MPHTVPQSAAQPIDRRPPDDSLEAAIASANDTSNQERPTKPAMLRGFRQTCPNCGRGHLFDGYLKVNQTCAVCGQELFHHRADDGPAYLTILIVGHIMAPLIHVVFTQFRPDPWVMATGFTIFVVALSLYLLPRLKGVVVAIQWAKRMGGFGGTVPA
jgi:uncharacterized protein (DUF983 family)